MEFHVQIVDALPDLEAVREAITLIDPAAVVDTDAGGGKLRVAAAFDALELRAALVRSGQGPWLGEIRQQPSLCCGGCGG